MSSPTNSCHQNEIGEHSDYKMRIDLKTSEGAKISKNGIMEVHP
jgi:hypothetical protein